MPVETIDYVKYRKILEDVALSLSCHRPIVSSFEFTKNSESDTRLKVIETVSKINMETVEE
jgi:hypothetical protein